MLNDQLREKKASAAAAQLSTDWESPQQPSSSTSHKRSQNGSRNSVSSVFEMAKDDKVSTVNRKTELLFIPQNQWEINYLFLLFG